MCLLEIDEESKKEKEKKVERRGMSKQPIRPVFQGSRRRGENRPGELLTTPPQLDNNSYIIIIEDFFNNIENRSYFFALFGLLW